jgi:predicted flap endonuclease-1-like 5' DNA nuclease
MIYKIQDIQGIGPAFAEKLIAIGIETVDQLLEKGADPKGRQAIEDATGIDHGRVLTWVNHADLFRVDGIGPQFSELLEAAGVDTVKDLRNRNAANLAAKMLEVNEEKHLTRRVPVEKELQKMIDCAKALEPKVTY